MLDSAIGLDATVALAWNGKGLAQKAERQNDEALLSFHEAIRLDPSLAASWNNAGQALRQLGRYEEALEAFDRASNLDAESSAPWNGKGNVYLAQARYEEALEAYKTATRIDPNMVSPWPHLGNVLTRLGRYTEARQALDRAIDLDPNLAISWFHRAALYRQVRDNAEASRSYYRFHYLEQGDRWLPESIQYFACTAHAPLFVEGLLARCSDVVLDPDLTASLKAVSEEITTARRFLAHIDSEPSGCSPIERAKLKGLVYHYMGDPFRAAAQFDEADTLDEKDMMVQYYFILSHQAFLADARDEIGFGRNQATRRVHGRGPDDILNSYYAGHLFALSQEYEPALSCFTAAGGFLPARYMVMWIHHSRSKAAERDKCIEAIVRDEQSIREGRKGDWGFLSSADVQIDPSDPLWKKRLLHYACAKEIGDAILVVYDLVRGHGAWRDLVRTHGRFAGRESLLCHRELSRMLITSWASG